MDIDERGARAEIAMDPDKANGVILTVTKGFTLDGYGWKRLVKEIDKMVEREQADGVFEEAPQ